MGRHLRELASTKLLWPEAHRFQRQIDVTQEPLERLEFSAEKINHLSQIRYKKGPRRALFVLKPKSLGQPGLNGIRAVFCLPLLQTFVIPTFGFDDLASVRIFVDLHLTWLTSASFGFDYWSAAASLRIQQVDDVRQAVTVFSKQSAQLRLKLYFLFETSIAFQCFESLELFGKVFFELAKFSKFGNV